MIDKVINHEILDTNAMSIVKAKATSKFFFKTQNNPKVSGKQRNVSDIQRKTFEALSAEYVVVGEEKVC